VLANKNLNEYHNRLVVKIPKRGPSQISAPAPPVVITKVDVDIQVQPTQDDQQTSTGDILSTK